MIKLITSRALPVESIQRRFLCSDPERLSRIAAAQQTNGSRFDEQASRDFSVILSSIWIGGTQKRTREKRLGEADRCLLKYLALRSASSVRFLDAGASDGITTWETVCEMRKELNCDVTALVLERYTKLLRFDSRLLREYRTSDGLPVMVRMGRVALPLAKVAQSNLAFSRWLGRTYLARNRFRAEMGEAKTISLIHPRAAAEPAIDVIEADALKRIASLENSFDAARASNFLNLAYFSPTEIETAIGHLHAYLRDGGHLVVSRNVIQGSEEIERGSIWEKKNDRFIRREDFGNGSEIAEIVDAFHPVDLSTVVTSEQAA